MQSFRGHDLIREPGSEGSAVETTIPPACLDCGTPLSLVSVVEKFGDRPAVRVFKCEECARLMMFFLENGQLRKFRKVKAGSLHRRGWHFVSNDK